MSASSLRSFNWRLAIPVLLAGLLCGGGVARLVAFSPPQQTAAAPAADVLPALLVEIRGLRAAMEQMASAGPRIQLSVARLQLQEGRINTMLRRLESVHDTLGIAQRELAALVDRQASIDARVAQNPTGAELEQLTELTAQTKRELPVHRATVERLTAEETQLTQDIAIEQARWTDINQRLDELERALAKR